MVDSYIGLDNSQLFADGYYKTGDVGYIDNKKLKIMDRCKDVIIVKGCNVSSLELEAVCHKMLGINCIVVAETCTK